MLQDISLVGFIDGSWRTTKDGIKMGIGGFFMDRQRKVQYLLTEPLQDGNQGWEVELRALHFMCTTIKEKLGTETNCCIATDCKSLHDDVCKSRSNLRRVDRASRYFLLINSMINTKVLLIKRAQNGEADKLAKNGVVRINMLSGWS